MTLNKMSQHLKDLEILATCCHSYLKPRTRLYIWVIFVGIGMTKTVCQTVIIPDANLGPFYETWTAKITTENLFQSAGFLPDQNGLGFYMGAYKLVVSGLVVTRHFCTII